MASVGDVLGRRALNRATLHRQLLLRRSSMPVAEAIEHLVGLQAQVPTAPYFGLWTRLDGFHPDQLSTLVAEREAVRISLMRGTIHLVTAHDSLALRPALQSLHDRFVQLTGLDGREKCEVAEAARALVEERPRTYAELGRLLARRCPEHAPGALAAAARALLPMVQVPPRGIWGASGPAAHTTVEAWLGRGLDPDPSPERLVLRYLAAFGPASVKDMQTWSGLTRFGEIVKRLRPQLCEFHDEAGTRLLDLPDAPRPDPDTPAPVRFLPEYDNSLRSHADRSRVMTDTVRRLLHTRNDSPKRTILVDGFVTGTWRLAQQRGAATLVVEPFDRLSDEDVAAVAAEGERLLAFAAASTGTREVRFTPAADRC